MTRTPASRLAFITTALLASPLLAQEPGREGVQVNVTIAQLPTSCAGGRS